MMQHNEYVLKNMFGSFFLATVLSALMSQLGGITDSIVVTHLVSPDSLSVVRVWQPFASCMFIIIGMMSAGASFLSARGIGVQNYDKVNRVFNHHLYYVIFSTLTVIAVVLPFLDVVAGMLTTDERLLPMLKPYIHADMFAIFIAAVCGVPISYVITNGSPHLITRRIIISQVLNVGFDLLLCGVFGMGMVGASLASALSNLLAFTSLVGYMRKNSKIFRLRRPEKVCSIKQYRECFSIGLPMLISALLAPVLAFIMNSLVIGKLGADGMYFFTIYFQISSICMLALSGSNTAISNIGGILLGEEDYDSFRMLTRRIFRILIPLMVTLSLLIFLFPNLLVKIYGADESLVEQCYTPLRLMSIAFLPNAISRTLSMLYFVQGHQKLCRWIEIVTNLGYIGIIVVMGLYTPKLIWYLLPVTAWLLLLVMVAMAYVVHRKNHLYAWPTLENTVPSNPAVTSSVPYTNEGVEDCWEILDYMHERNLAVSLFTNAQALNTSEKIRRIARLGLQKLSVSIYSTDAEVHDHITRRRKSWEQSVKALRDLSAWPVPLNIKTPVFRLNSRTYYGVRQMAYELGAETEVSCTLNPGADGDVSMIEHLQTRPEALRIILMDSLGKGHVPEDGKADGYAFGSNRGFPCSANSLITISPSGVVSGCSNIPITFGDMHHASLKEVILSPQRLLMLQTVQKQAFTACGGHDYCQYCRVPCYAGESLEKHADGTFTLKEIQGDGCMTAKIRMELCRQIEQGIDPLGGKTIEECLAALPVEEVPKFRKRIRK